jgi:hypothetical protein
MTDNIIRPDRWMQSRLTEIGIVTEIHFADDDARTKLASECIRLHRLVALLSTQVTAYELVISSIWGPKKDWAPMPDDVKALVNAQLRLIEGLKEVTK